MMNPCLWPFRKKTKCYLVLFILLVVVVLTPRSADAQQRTPKSENGDQKKVESLPPLKREVDSYSNINSFKWETVHIFPTQEALKKNTKNNAEALADLQAIYLGRKSAPNKLFLRYQKETKTLFERLTTVGNESALFISDEMAPIAFSNFNGKTCFMITGLVLPNVYNTLRNTSKARAAKVIASHILPVLSYFHDAFKKSDMGYYSVTAVYASRDFSTDSRAKAETVSLVVSKGNCQKFISGEIADNELLKGSQIYLRDRDMHSGTKKVELSID